MLIYNITVKVENTILEKWMKWQMEEHIPEIMSSNLFIKHKVFRLLEQDDNDGSTFVFQYYASAKTNYDKYIQEYAPVLREKALKKWGDRFVAFRSLLETVK